MDTVLFVLGRLGTSLASPVCLFLILLLVLSLRVLRSMERPRLRSAFLALWFLALCFSLPVLSNALVAWWEAPRGPDPQGHWDAAVVLGGVVDAAESDGWQIEMNDNAERVVAAARLYHEGRVDKIYLSGGSGDLHFPEAREAPLLKRLLEGMGVPTAAIVVEDRSRNSFENAAFVKPLLAAGGVKRCVLISSALHMPRARAIFEKAGFNGPGQIGMDALAVDSLRQAVVFPESFIPNAQAVTTNSRVLKEIIGFAGYRVLGRL